MPLYEYSCNQCSLSFEELVSSSSAAPVVSCPRCKANDVTRQLSVFAAHSGASHGCAGGCAEGGCGESRAERPAGGCCGGACGCHSS